MRMIAIAALLAGLLAAGCVTRPPAASQDTHPFPRFVDPVTEEVPRVQFEIQ